MNIKSGFNRFFVVLTAFWAVFCLFVYPNQEHQEAEKTYKSEMRYCHEHELGNSQEFKDCLARDEFSSSVNMWSLRAFYARESWFLVLVVIVIPLIAYGLGRVLAAVGSWVWHGFKPNRPTPPALH